MTMPFEILPAIDLRGDRVVRLRQGDFSRETVYEGRPDVVAGAFVAEGARWIHVVDLDGARAGHPMHREAVAAIVAAVAGRARVEVAGGLRTEAAIAETLAAGASRIVVGTAALDDAAFVERLIGAHGPQRVAVAIDVREGRAVGHGWVADSTEDDAAEAIGRLAAAGVETFEVTAIELDGLLEGPDLALYERLARDGHAIIASGGITTIVDLRALRVLGCTGAIVGRALYEGQLDLGAALAEAGAG